MSAMEQHMLLSTGYGGEGYFSMRKNIAAEVGETASILNAHFHDIFLQLSLFQTYLDTQRGHAVTRLKTKLQHHMEFLSNSAPTILYFIDVTESALQTFESTDLGSYAIRYPHYQDGCSSNMSGEEQDIESRLATFSLTKEARLLEHHSSRISDILTRFDHIIDHVQNHTTIPWGEYSSIWSEAQYVCSDITFEMDRQVAEIMRKTNVLITEMDRLKHFLDRSTTA